MCKPIVATGVCRAFSVADVVGSGENDVADFREVASEGAVERVACNVTQGFWENAGNGESDYREVVLEGVVERVECNVSQGNKHSTWRRRKNRGKISAEVLRYDNINPQIKVIKTFMGVNTFNEMFASEK